MRSRRGCGARLTMRALWLLVLLAGVSTCGLANNRLRGVARNLSRNEPAAGDEVILLRLDQGMQEEARSKADPQGAFAFSVEYPDKLYVVRVMHQGVNYDQQVSPQDAVLLDVFDAARKVRKVAGTIEILRTGTNGSRLHVSDMYEIENRSDPPLTQASERTFEVYLPAAAEMDSVLAAGPGKIAVLISARPLAGEPGHYTVNFPLRPGATKFAFNYDLPYDGHAVFQTRRVYTLEQLAVMIPPTMRFSSSSTAFENLPAGDTRYRVQVANQLSAGEGPGFEISGGGAISPIIEPPAPQPSPPSTGSLGPTPPVGRPALQLPAGRVDSRPKVEPSSSQSVLTGVAVVLLGVCLFLRVRARKHCLNRRTHCKADSR